jgi:hypothetical protein
MVAFVLDLVSGRTALSSIGLPAWEFRKSAPEDGRQGTLGSLTKVTGTPDSQDMRYQHLRTQALGRLELLGSWIWCRRLALPTEAERSRHLTS